MACGTNNHGLGPMQDGEEVVIEIEKIGKMSVKVKDPYIPLGCGVNLAMSEADVAGIDQPAASLNLVTGRAIDRASTTAITAATQRILRLSLVPAQSSASSGTPTRGSDPATTHL